MTNLPVLLPSGFFPIVQEGELLAVGQVIAQKTTTSQESINIAQALSLPLSKAGKVLRKSAGDKVNRGDILAVKQGFLGMDQETIISKYAGTVLRYERGSGNLLIQTGLRDKLEELFSPVAGRVVMCNNDKIIIETEKNVVTADGGWGESAEGEVFVLRSSFDANEPELTADSIAYLLDSRAIGKIIIVKRFNKDFLLKGIGIGAKGMIGVDVAEEAITYVALKKFQTPILTVSETAISQLLSWEGKKVFIDAKSKAVILLQIANSK